MVRKIKNIFFNRLLPETKETNIPDSASGHQPLTYSRFMLYIRIGRLFISTRHRQYCIDFMYVENIITK